MKILLTILPVLFFTSCINPFAPALTDSDGNEYSLGDQKTIDGFFQMFQYAYNMKDTIIYSNLLAPNFIFAYTNFEKGIDLTLSREEDMLTTYRLFNASKKIDFTWNKIVIQEGNNVEQNISRSFSLTVTFSPTDIEYVSGKVYFVIKRDNENENWQLTYWQDDSYY